MTALDDADRALRHMDGAAALAGYAAAGADPEGRALAGRVRALWLLRRWTEARDLLAALPDNVHTWLAAGTVALGQPDYAAWLAVDCGSARRDDDAALRSFDAALKHDPAHPDAVAGRATALRMSGQPTKAREYLRLQPQAVRDSAPVQVELAMCAAELNDDVAAEHAEQALALDPDHVHAALVRLELALRSDQDRIELAGQAEDLAERYPVPDVQITLGWLRYTAGAADDAFALFTAVLEHGTHPTAVRGAILARAGDRGWATKLVTTSQVTEPASPYLRNLATRQTTAAGADLEHQLALWRTVLDADPRYLDARIAVAEVLTALDRTDEAAAVVNRLRAELPSNTRVVEAWLRLATPWRMPEFSPTRIERPWATGADDRTKVLAVLVKEVVSRLGLTPEIAERLEARLAVDNGHVFRQAVGDEQTYLDERDRHLADVAHAQRFRPLRFAAEVVTWLSEIAVAASAGFFCLLLLGLTALPAPVIAGAPIAVAVGLVAYFRWQEVDLVTFLSYAAGSSGLIWQASSGSAPTGASRRASRRRR